MRRLHWLNCKINSVEVFFSAIHTVWTLWSCIYDEFKDTLRKNSSNEYFKAILHYFLVLFTLGLYNGRSMNTLIFFFVALRSSGRRSFGVKSSTARFRAVVFAARCYLPHKYFAIRQDSHSPGDSPTSSKQKMNEMSPSRLPCCLETQNARWRHAEWRLKDLFMACC